MEASTVKAMVMDTCKAFWEKLVEEHTPAPSTERLKQSRAGFLNVWNFPQGVSDPEYKFITIDVGAKGSQNDGGTFAASSLCASLESKNFNMPPDCELPTSSEKLPNVLIADEAYPLKPYLLKPYARKNLTPAKTAFNYRLSRARRCIECAFGILYAKWRILGKDIETSVPNAIAIIKCTCVLHNVIRDKDGENDPVYREVRFNGLQSAPLHKHRRNNRYTTLAEKVHDTFANYLKTQRLLKGD
ncbi:protein ALP1-like [Cryptotermes secundus]|nr:protein ALP1-like [Cryptotermes secundus]